MLCHIPFGNILLTALITDERPHAQMLAHMDLEVRAGVVFLGAPWKFTMKFIDVLMCFLMISQNPFLAELGLASRKRTLKFLVLIFLVGRQMVREMLGHLESFLTAWVIAFVKSH